MGFRGRIWLDAGRVGVLITAVAFALLANVEPLRAVKVAGWCLALYAALYVVVGVLTALGLGSLDDEIVDRRMWALGGVLSGLGLGVFAAIGIVAYPVPPEPSWGLWVVVLGSVGGALEWAASSCEHRAAPDVEGAFYRRPKHRQFDGADIFVGPGR